MAALFDEFPRLRGQRLLLRKLEESDVDALSQITDNENVYRYIPPFLYKKSRGFLRAAILNLGGRDFDKKKRMIAGGCRADAPERVVGLAEMFDYKKRVNEITIGYRVNESCWHEGIATEVVAMLVRYLSFDMGVSTVKAFVMPQNVYSVRALVSNGFQKQARAVEGKNWGGQATVLLDEYVYTR